MTKNLRSLLSTTATIATGLLLLGCGDTVINVPTAPTPTPTAAIQKHSVQFRVTGNATSVVVRYSTPTNGLAQDVTALPFFSSFTTTASSVFLSLDATPTTYPFSVVFPFLNVQIVVDDNVFQQASSQDFLSQMLSVSGTWRQ